MNDAPETSEGLQGMGRRAFLAATAAGAGIALGGIGRIGPRRATGLAAAAESRGRRFGSCVAWSEPGADRGSFANPAYAQLLRGDCALLVAENEMKWQALRPDAAQFRFDRADAMMAWADAEGFLMRGHTLLWYDPARFPGWLTKHDFGAQPATAAVKLVTEHVDTVARRYGEQIYSWDVVNEAVQPQTGAIRRNSLADAVGGGTDVIDAAFHVARAALPNTELVYNDYMSWEGGENVPHRAGVLKLLEGFRKKNVPVDALGVQSHIGVFDGTPVAEQVRRFTPEWRRFLDEVVAMGYRLVITELDVRDDALMPDRVRRAQAVSDYAQAYMDVMLEYPQLRDILAWGMSDRFSWLQNFAPRKDGLEKIACPFDSGFKPHPMHAALGRSLAAARAL